MDNISVIWRHGDLQGPLETFDWTAATGVTNASDGATVIKSNAPSGDNIHIEPPIDGVAPNFTVVENAPLGSSYGLAVEDPFPGSVAYQDAAGNPVDVQYTFANPVGNTWTYTATIVPAVEGTIVSGMNGQFDYDGINTISNSNSTNLVIKSAAGLEVRTSPPH